MWVSKFNLESMITPKYLTLLLWFNTELFNVTLKIGGALLILGLMVKTLDLEGFTVSFLALNQIEIFCRSSFIAVFSIDGVGPEYTKQVPSAKIEVCN